MYGEGMPVLKKETSQDGAIEKFNKFSDYEQKAFEGKKSPKSNLAAKLTRAFVLGTFLVGASVGYVAVEAKPAQAQELVNKSEHKEQLRVLISGTIDGKITFEIDKTNYNPDDDKDFLRAKKSAEDDFIKSNALEREAGNKRFKIIINGKEAKIIGVEKFMDGGSHLFETDLGTFFIAHPLAKDFETGKKVQSRFSTSDGNEYTIQIKLDNLFR